MLRTLLLATATVALASPAFADRDPPAIPAVIVGYKDLDLDRRPDAARLVSRIEIAAADVCADWEDLYDVDEDEGLAVRRCTHVAETRAVAAVGHPNVTASYYGRNPRVIIEDDLG